MDGTARAAGRRGRQGRAAVRTAAPAPRAVSHERMHSASRSGRKAVLPQRAPARKRVAQSPAPTTRPKKKAAPTRTAGLRGPEKAPAERLSVIVIEDTPPPPSAPPSVPAASNIAPGTRTVPSVIVIEDSPTPPPSPALTQRATARGCPPAVAPALREAATQQARSDYKPDRPRGVPGNGVKMGKHYTTTAYVADGSTCHVLSAVDGRDGKIYAIKIAHLTKTARSSARCELRIFEIIQNSKPPDFDDIILFYCSFTFRGHTCLVLQHVEATLWDVWQDYGCSAFPAAHVQAFATQLLRALDFLQSHRIVHGDVKTENIGVAHVDVMLGPVPGSKPWLLDTKIFLMDFGLSQVVGAEETWTGAAGTLGHMAPETESSWSFPVDAFALGCVLFELLTGKSLFGRKDDAVTVKKKLEREKKEKEKNPAFKSRLQVLIPDGTPARGAFCDLLGRLIELDPRERMTPREGLEHDAILRTI
ncbi:kinase-like protein [Auricularia subglabra TFB-10046 SS5]|uniref:Kinase-like protein n=1 Tax=Auricularia subglabra (strain TFB-10046 / SS5) TaxID=717982 RepID=J0CS56_AURST|nr:kinase-like protein [Auricularia subglabra TFB-10046 SS5]